MTLGATSVDDGRLRVEAPPATDADKVRDWVKDRGVLTPVAGSDGALEFTLSERWKQEVRERGMAQVLEVLRRRIEDPIQGIPDSVVTRQGDDRILVQIPGGAVDRARAREHAEGHRLPRVQDRARRRRRPRSCCARSTRTGCRPTPRSPSSATRRSQRVLSAYLVGEKADLTGDYLEDARVGFDHRQRPIVDVPVQRRRAASIFRKLTGEHIGEQLAIVLDDRVYSAPVIRSRIGSRGQIEGRFTLGRRRPTSPWCCARARSRCR